MSTRFYEVKDGEGKVRLVKAGNRAQAVGFCARGHFKAEVAGSARLVELLQGGTQIEDATAAEEVAEAGAA